MKIDIIKYFILDYIRSWTSKIGRRFAYSLAFNYLIPTIGCLIVLFVISIFHDHNFQNLIAILAGITFTRFSDYLKSISSFFYEDSIKVNADKLNYSSEYFIKFNISGKKVQIIYDPLYLVRDLRSSYEMIVFDSQEFNYEPPSIISYNFTKLLSLHKNEFIENFNCIRLDDIDIDGVNNIVSLFVGRVRCFDHLVTNFAMDYKLDNGASIREIYESGAHLSALRDSKMANQIGFNCLVFLSDDVLLIPHRGNNSSISKNMFTSSIAMPYRFDDNQIAINSDDLLITNIKNALITRLGIEKNFAQTIKIRSVFLGLGRDVLWGGKPQMYFYARLDIKSLDYLRHSSFFDSKGRIMDKDKRVLLVSGLNYIENSGVLRLECIDSHMLLHHTYRITYIAAKAECSFFNNLYHFSIFNSDDTLNNWLHKKLV